MGQPGPKWKVLEGSRTEAEGQKMPKIVPEGPARHPRSIDHDVTKAAVLVPCREAITADEFATLYETNVFRCFGLLKKLISDRSTQFTSKWFTTLCTRLGINQAQTTAYHPQADGQTECLNQEVEQYLRIFCNHRQDNWACLLPLAKFSHNAMLQASIKTTPFQALMGYTSRAHVAPSVANNIPAIAHCLDNLTRLRSDLQASHRLAAQHMASRIDKAPPIYQVGDKVWLDATNLKTSHLTTKLAPKRYGPFSITKVLGPVTFALALPLVNGMGMGNPQWVMGMGIMGM
ncbi:hypothetical protein EWM64_g7121, partial [Hericium alpestre]